MADINMSASELYGLAVKLGKDLQKQKKANEKLNKENKYQRQVMDTGNKVMEIAIKNNDKLSEEIIKKDKIINNYKKKLQEMLMEQFEEEEDDCCNMGCENKSEEKYIVVRDNGFVEHNCKECYKRDYEEKYMKT